MNSTNKDSFWYKYKNDDKYKAKVQLILYVVFIVFVIVYINVGRIGSNYNYNNVVGDANNDIKYEEKSNLLDTINNNYNYLVSVLVNSKKDDNVEEIKYEYSGKKYKDNTIIDKKNNGSNVTYYKIGDEYYAKENDEYKFIDSSVIYDLINKKYIELSDVKRLITKASLEHVTNESNGNNNYKYNLLVRDVIQTYKGNDLINIDVTIKNDILHIDIDYSNLFKQIDDKISTCKVSYEYTDIDKVEEFTIIDDNE